MNSSYRYIAFFMWTLFPLFLVLGSTFPAYAMMRTRASTAPSSSISAIPGMAHVISHHIMNMHGVSGRTIKPTANFTHFAPQRMYVDPQQYKMAVEKAIQQKTMPQLTTTALSPDRKQASASSTPGLSNAIQGQSLQCCAPPDMALAASSQWVLQGVNTYFAIYDTTGNLQNGWPKASTDFFGVPSPGSCSANGAAFMSDPRAFYDVRDQRFWAAMLEVEGADGVNSCPFKTVYWIAVSQTSDPGGQWNVYSYDMSLGTSNFADYTQFGFDRDAIYFTGNMFAASGGYQYAEIFGASKPALESGNGVTAYGFYKLKILGTLVDTVQPVESFDNNTAGLFINSFNMNSFGCIATCTGVTVWTLTNPGTSQTRLNGLLVLTSPYMRPPLPDQPGCNGCVGRAGPQDTRISGTPTYYKGLISFALGTGALNASLKIVPTIFWGQVKPVFDSNGAVNGANIYQSGYFGYTGDGAAIYPALMPDANGNLFMVFDFMNNQFAPSIAYVARRSNDPAGRFADAGFFLKVGVDPTKETRWGDFEATAYSGDRVWFAAEYSARGGDWSSSIGASHF